MSGKRGIEVMSDSDDPDDQGGSSPPQVQPSPPPASPEVADDTTEVTIGHSTWSSNDEGYECIFYVYWCELTVFTIRADVTQSEGEYNKVTTRIHLKVDSEDVVVKCDHVYANISVSLPRSMKTFQAINDRCESSSPSEWQYTKTFEADKEHAEDVLQSVKDLDITMRLKNPTLNDNIFDAGYVIEPANISKNVRIAVVKSGDAMYPSNIQIHNPIDDRLIQTIEAKHKTFYEGVLKRANPHEKVVFYNLDGRKKGELEEATARDYLEKKVLNELASETKQRIERHFLPLTDFEGSGQLAFARKLQRHCKRWTTPTFVVIHCSAGWGRSGFAVQVIAACVNTHIRELVDNLHKQIEDAKGELCALVQPLYHDSDDWDEVEYETKEMSRRTIALLAKIIPEKTHLAGFIDLA